MVAAQKLLSCNSPGFKRVQCEIRSGHLLLRGEVRSYYLKQLAQEVLRSPHDVCRIVNQLEVVYTLLESQEIDSSLGESQ